MVALLLPLAGLVPIVREAPGVYRPRHPERTPFYGLLEERFEEFALVHEERFERKDGPLRAAVRKAVDAFLACGRPENGFARGALPGLSGGVPRAVFLPDQELLSIMPTEAGPALRGKAPRGDPRTCRAPALRRRR